MKIERSRKKPVTPTAIISRNEETYYPDGRILEARIFGKGQILQFRVVSIYDDRKQLIEQIFYRPDDSIYKRGTIHYQDRKTNFEMIEYDPQGRIVSQISTKNDNQTDRVNSISIGPGRTVQSQASTTRNSDGSQEFRAERTDGYFSRQVIADNNQGGTDRTVYNADGTIKERVRRLGAFDSYQNLIKSTFLTATGDSSEFRLTTITYRSITYYPKD